MSATAMTSCLMCLQRTFVNKNAVRCLEKSSLRIHYDEDGMIDLATNLKERKIAADAVLYNAGDVADYWAIVGEGIMTMYGVRDDGTEQKMCEKSAGDFIGSDMLSESALRQLTARAQTYCVVYILRKQVLDMMITKFKTVKGNRGKTHPLLQFIESVGPEAILVEMPLFKGISPSHLQLIANAIHFRGVHKGETVIKEGQEGGSMFVVQRGELHAVGGENNSVVLNTFIKGHYFGELALILQMPRTADVVAVEKSIILELRKDDLDRLLVLDEGLQEQIHSRMAHRVAQQFRRYKSHFFDAFSNASLVKLAAMSEIRIVEADKLVMVEGDIGEHFFLIVHGEVGLTWNGREQGKDETENCVRLKSGAYFGELSLMRNEPRNSSVRTLTRCVFMTLDKLHFSNFFVGDMCTEPSAAVHLKLAWHEGDIDLTDTLLHASGFNALLHYCNTEHTDESVLFWRACEMFVRSTDMSETEMVAKARSIYVTYFGVEAKLEVNVSGQVITSLKEAIGSKSTITLEMFENAKRQVRALIASEIYPRFMKSAEYKAFVDEIASKSYLHSMQKNKSRPPVLKPEPVDAITLGSPDDLGHPKVSNDANRTALLSVATSAEPMQARKLSLCKVDNGAIPSPPVSGNGGMSNFDV